jgi:hypothetical protein
VTFVPFPRTAHSQPATEPPPADRTRTPATAMDTDLPAIATRQFCPACEVAWTGRTTCWSCDTPAAYAGVAGQRALLRLTQTWSESDDAFRPHGHADL